MNEAKVDYIPGTYRMIKITEDTVIEFDKPQDVKVHISVDANKEVEVVMNYAAEETLNIQTDIDIDDGAKVKLIQIDSSPKGNRLINRVNANINEEAVLNVIQIMPGRGEVYTGCTAELKGNRSECYMDVAYLATKDQKIDMNYVANHRGKATLSNIKADGVLKENAFKVFRDTLNFISGASGSKGEENEKVLLLGDDAINQSIPLILCTEEDVEGAHGAQIGSLPDDVMFYFASRGINREQAEKMISYGSFNRLIRMIDDEKIRENTEKNLLEVL